MGLTTSLVYISLRHVFSLQFNYKFKEQVLGHPFCFLAPGTFAQDNEAPRPGDLDWEGKFESTTLCVNCEVTDLELKSVTSNLRDCEIKIEEGIERGHTLNRLSTSATLLHLYIEPV